MTLPLIFPVHIAALVLFAVCLSGCESQKRHSTSTGHAATDTAEFTPETGVQDALHHASSEAAKLYAAAKEISEQTANRPVLQADADSAASRQLRSRLDELDKQQARLEAQTSRVEAYKTHNPTAWKSDDENLLLEVQISVRSIATTLADTRKELGKKHRWYFLGL